MSRISQASLVLSRNRDNCRTGSGAITLVHFQTLWSKKGRWINNRWYRGRWNRLRHRQGKLARSIELSTIIGKMESPELSSQVTMIRACYTRTRYKKSTILKRGMNPTLIIGWRVSYIFNFYPIRYAFQLRNLKPHRILPNFLITCRQRMWNYRHWFTCFRFQKTWQILWDIQK